jgi:hypothetical protein
MTVFERGKLGSDSTLTVSNLAPRVSGITNFQAAHHLVRNASFLLVACTDVTTKYWENGIILERGFLVSVVDPGIFSLISECRSCTNGS